MNLYVCVYFLCCPVLWKYVMCTRSVVWYTVQLNEPMNAHLKFMKSYRIDTLCVGRLTFHRRYMIYQSNWTQIRDPFQFWSCVSRVKTQNKHNRYDTIKTSDLINGRSHINIELWCFSANHHNTTHFTSKEDTEHIHGFGLSCENWG